MTADAGTAETEQLRLMVMASQLYHLHGLRQRHIGDRLNVSQARVSRLIQRAHSQGLVRRVLAVPEGLLPELEETIEDQYPVAEVHVVDVGGTPPDIARALGRAAARYLGEAVVHGRIIGLTSWSVTLQEMAFALAAAPRPAATHVVEMLGDLGSPSTQHGAARATQAMATALGATPVFLRTPGVLPTPELRDRALGDAHVRQALGLLDSLDIAFIGVGPPSVHGMLSAGDYYFSPQQLDDVRRAGAAGQINQRFLDDRGQPVATDLDDLVVGSTLEQVRAAGRRVVVAGSADKHQAIRAALRGGWVDVLLTDLGTALELAEGAAGR